MSPGMLQDDINILISDGVIKNETGKHRRLLEATGHFTLSISLSLSGGIATLLTGLKE